MDEHHYFLRNYYQALQHQGFSNAAISASLAKYYSEHQARVQRANSLQSSCEPSQFAELCSVPCDNTDSDDEILGDLFECNENFEFFDFEPADTSSAVMHTEPTHIMTSQQPMCITPPPPKRDSSVKQLRQNPEQNLINSNWVFTDFDEADFLVGDADIPSMQGEDTTCAYAADCPQVSVPLLHPPNQELSYANTCAHGGTDKFLTHSDVNVNTATSVGHCPEEQQYAKATDIPTMKTKHPNAPTPSREFHNSQEQELASKQILETEETFEALPLTRKRPFKNVREKRRRDTIKVKYDELYNLCQDIESKTVIMPALRSEDDPNKSKKSRQKLEILGDVFSLMEKMEQELTGLRARNKRLKSHHS